MGESFIDIILFGMIAAFLILRLRSVLGRHKDSGAPQQRNQQDPFAPPQNDTQDADASSDDNNVISLPGQEHEEATNEQPDIEKKPETPLDAGITQIRIAAPDFDQTEFLVGARTAFEMIIQAFAEGDTDLLNSLLSDEVYNNFESAIRSREADNQVLENTLVRIVDAEMIEAYMADSIANVTIKIMSEQVNVTLDQEGEVVDGDPDHISDITDIWTFARDTNSQDPNWRLVATRSLD